MPNSADIQWFKVQFADRIAQAVYGTPFSVDMLTAIACQETGYIWSTLRKQNIALADILRLCTGDTIDAKPGGGGRRAFPKNKAALMAVPDGPAMFAVARHALLDMSNYIPGYSGAAANPDKFCHAFGLFQYDLQYFEKDKPYFLSGGYADFDTTVAKCIGELREALKAARLQLKPVLDDGDMAAVAIAYNTGRYDPARKLKQGYYDGQYYYGEYFANYLQAAHEVSAPALVTGSDYVVKVQQLGSSMNMRKTADKSADNVMTSLPNGTHVRVLSLNPENGFLKIEAMVNGKKKTGYGWSAYLIPA